MIVQLASNLQSHQLWIHLLCLSQLDYWRISTDSLLTRVCVVPISVILWPVTWSSCDWASPFLCCFQVSDKQFQNMWQSCDIWVQETSTTLFVRASRKWQRRASKMKVGGLQRVVEGRGRERGREEGKKGSQHWLEGGVTIHWNLQTLPSASSHSTSWSVSLQSQPRYSQFQNWTSWYWRQAIPMESTSNQCSIALVQTSYTEYSWAMVILLTRIPHVGNSILNTE